MVEINMEITKEQYEEYKDKPSKLGSQLISMEEFMGYGVYTQRLVEDGGKYFLRYDRGTSCD
ncbi:MAG: hypothetical protein IJ880_13305 [Bacilli bacterium]|nr:hypothetical protein [Bacilli bacterium]